MSARVPRFPGLCHWMEREGRQMESVRTITSKKILVSAILIFLLMAACGGQKEQKTGQSALGDRYGGTLVVGEIGDVDALNPLVSSTRNASDVEGMLFLTLTEINPDLDTYSPSLARSWEFSEDHLRLTFHLRDDVFWTDGIQTTAHDVKFSFEKQTDPLIAWSAIRWKEFIEDVQVVDDTTVTFIFKEIYPYQLMDASVGSILPKHRLEDLPSESWKTCDFNRQPLGNGPFKFKRWVSQQTIELVANEDYYDGRPFLDRIVFRIIPDQTSLLAQLKSGDVDLMESIPPKDVARMEEDFRRERSDVRLVKYPSRAYGYIGWNLKNPLFESNKVRQALTMAIDRQNLIEAVYFGLAQPCHSPISPILWAYNPDMPVFPYDPHRAKQLLAEEGWIDHDGDGWIDKEGRKFEFTLKTNQGNRIREDITVIVQDQLAKVGMKANPRLIEWTVFSDQTNRKEFEAIVAGWSVGLKVDLTTMWHSESINDKFNYVSYSNPRVDELIEVAKREMDRSKAKLLWDEAQRLIVDDQPYTFLYIPEQVNGIHKRFRDVQMDTRGSFIQPEKWWVPKDERKY
jgi:peptide/nickel transport system substrate-binding protein